MLLQQGGSVLVEVIGTGRDEAIDATGDGSSRAGVSNKENRLVALDLCFGRNSVPNERLALFKASDELISVKRIRTRSDYSLCPYNGRDTLDV